MILRVLFNPHHSVYTTGADGAQGTGIVEFHPLATANVVVHTCHGEKLPNMDKKLQVVPLASGHLPVTKSHSRLT